MSVQGWIVMPAWDYEGLTADEQPYEVYYSREDAEKVRRDKTLKLQPGPRPIGPDRYFVVEVISR